MRIRVHHQTTYAYDRPAQSMVQLLRLTPRDHEGQYVRRWRIDLDEGGVLRAREDAFGNVLHVLSASGNFSSFTLSVDGEVETHDTAGVIRGGIERFPPELFLRDTPLTQADPAIADFARGAVANAGTGDLARLHELLRALNRHMTFDVQSTHAATTAVEAFGLQRGVCQDLAHVFIGAARALGIPCRYVSGHLLRNDGAGPQEAGHAWAEAYVGGLGWVGFDPANGICPTDAYVRVGIGLDYLGAAPVRGAQVGGSDERLSVTVEVGRDGQQQQQQG